MPYTVAVSFDEFFEAINLPGDHRELANARRDELIKLLKNHFTIVEAFPTGSIPRFTALRARADLDIIAALHYGNHIENKTPAQVLQAVRDALAEYRTDVRRNGQAVTLYYDTWPNVDVVPASRVVGDQGNVVSYSIPDTRRGRWLTSKPKRHSETIEQRSSQCGPSFRKVVKMAKHWSLEHGDLLQSYHIEVLSLNTFSGQMNDMPWDVFQWFERASNLLQSPLWYEGAHVDDYLSDMDRRGALRRLQEASSLARDAWHKTYGQNSDHKGAIALWRQIFGDKFPQYG